MTDKKKIDELLNMVDVPRIQLREAKVNLRKELLERWNIKKTRVHRKTLMFKFAWSGIAAILAIIIIFTFEFMPQRMSAKELIANLESAYHHSFDIQKLHYMNIRLQTTERKKKIIFLEKWVYRDNQARFLFQGEGKQILAHYIFVNNKKYGWQGMGDQVNVTFEKKLEKKDSQNFRRIIVLPLADASKGKKQASIIIVNDKLDIFGFCNQSPKDIFQDLKSTPGIKYVGKEIDRETGQTLEVLQRRSSSEVKSYILVYESDLSGQVKRFIEKLNSSEIPLNKKSGQGRARVGEIKVVETTKINKKSGKIHQISYELFKDKQTIIHHELTFLAENFSEYNPDTFDVQKFGLKEIIQNP
jgi:hypothetical protein